MKYSGRNDQQHEINLKFRARPEVCFRCQFSAMSVLLNFLIIWKRDYKNIIIKIIGGIKLERTDKLAGIKEYIRERRAGFI